jgi:hypothetical protein
MKRDRESYSDLGGRVIYSDCVGPEKGNSRTGRKCKKVPCSGTCKAENRVHFKAMSRGKSLSVYIPLGYEKSTGSSDRSHLPYSCRRDELSPCNFLDNLAHVSPSTCPVQIIGYSISLNYSCPHDSLSSFCAGASFNLLFSYYPGVGALLRSPQFPLACLGLILPPHPRR